MTMEELKILIVNAVTEKQGCKAMELVANESIVKCSMGEQADLASAINELVEERRLIEVEYILPGMDHRFKSFLLPALTALAINKGSLIADVREG